MPSSRAILSSTRTPQSTAPCRGSASSSAPGCSESSGTTPNATTRRSSRRNYAATSPLTVASGRKRTVRARFVRNRRLSDAADRWALCSLQASPGCHDFYDRRRAAGDLHHQALRALGNRLVGYLHGCLRTRACYDEATAWAHRHDREQLAA